MYNITFLKFPEKPRHVCATCGKSYKYYEGLYDHQRFQCGKEPTFACPYCPKKCHMKGNLLTHVVSCGKFHEIERESFMKTFNELKYTERRTRRPK